MAWVHDLETMLHWEGATLEGQHVLISDTAQCSGAFLLLWALQRFKEVQFVCLFESPLHYQTVSRKLGGGAKLEGVQWLKSLKELKNVEGKCVIVDSWYPLQCEADDVLDVGDEIRQLRQKLGAKGVLVSRLHSDCLEPRWIGYESDIMLSVREVGSNDVTGRLSLTQRSQKEPNEFVFTVLSDHVSFKRI